MKGLSCCCAALCCKMTNEAWTLDLEPWNSDVTYTKLNVIDPHHVNVWDSQTQFLKNSATVANSTHTASSLKMVLLNIRALTNETFIVINIISLDCILFTENWLNETVSEELSVVFPCYFLIFTLYQVYQEGLFFSDILSCKTLPLSI